MYKDFYYKYNNKILIILNKYKNEYINIKLKLI